MRHVCIALALLAAAGCSDGRGVALIRVTGRVNNIDHFSVDASAANQVSNGNMIAPMQRPFSLPPDQTFSLGFDKMHLGMAHVTVNAISPTGATLATASTTFEISENQSVSATVDFGGNPVDMGMPGDGGMLPDLTIPSSDDGPQPNVPIPLVVNEPDPNYLLIDLANGQLYWNNRGGGSIGRVNTDGSNHITVSAGDGLPTNLAIDSSHIYWTDQNAGQVKSALLNGAPNTFSVVDATANQAVGIGSNGAFAYWTDNADGTLSSIDLATGSSIILYQNMGHNFGTLLLYGGLILFSDTDPNGNAHLSRVATDGTGFMTITGSEPTNLALSAPTNEVYFTESTTGNVWFYNASMPNPIQVALGQNQPQAVAADGAYVYWTNYGDGTIRRAPLTTNGKDTLVIDQQGTPFGIAVDDNFIYWTVRGDGMGGGMIMKLQKQP